MKIDIYAHVGTPRFIEERFRNKPMPEYVRIRLKAISDLETRFRLMDRYEGYVQVLTPSGTPLEVLPRDESVHLAKTINDEMSEWVAKYPDRFPAAVAALPMNDLDVALLEVDRAIKELGMKGVLIYTDINGKLLDSPDLMPLYEKMVGYDLPIWLHPHPWGKQENPDYVNRKRETFFILERTFGWPYETSLAMGRLVFGGVMEKYPDLKIITHHCGGQVPFLEQRIEKFYENVDTKEKVKTREKLSPHKTVLDYLRMFYTDTALYGNAPALMCGYAFYGADRLLFGTDMPYGGPEGDEVVVSTIDAVNEMNVTDSEKKKIFEENAKKLLKLS